MLPVRCIVLLPMKYLEEKTIARLNLISLLLIIALLSLGMGFLFISGYNDVFKSELKNVEEDYVFLRKEKIRNVVDLKVADIENRDNKIPDILKEKLKKQVFAAHNIASIIYHTYKDSKNEKEIRLLVIEALRSIRHDKGEGYYLLCEKEQKLILCPDPDMLKNLIFEDYPNDDADEILRKMMRRAKTHGESYFTFKDRSGNPEKAGILFLKRFDIFKWFIGSLGRSHKIESSIKSEVLSDLREESLRDSSQNPFEVYQLIEGDKGKQSLAVLLHTATPALEGQELTVFFQDAKGTRYVDRLISQIKTNGSSFIEFWDIDKAKGSPKLKLTYYKLYPKWNWIVAMGFHFEDSDMLNIQRMMIELEKEIQTKIKSATGLFLFFIMLSILISVFFSKRIARIFNRYKQEVEDRNIELGKKNTQLNTEIKERRRIEDSLRKNEEKLRMLASEVQLTEERERRRIAGDLHDSIGASLAISNLKLEMLTGKIDIPEISSDLKMVHENIKRVIQQTRSLTFQLSPPVLYQMGLEAALAGLAEQTQSLHGITTEFSDDEQEKFLEEDVRIHIFRSIRELLVNVIKHAHARHIKIEVARVNQEIQIIVSDDGIGFNSTDQTMGPEEGGKFGLFSISERLRLLGGFLEIQSAPGQGTRVLMRAPLKNIETIKKRVS
ncbi:cache domain-containing protein [bacterium]|nr:cache domain-containing protein [bacterium]